MNPPLPREHGAYIVLACSWILGLIQAPGIDIPYALLSLVAVAMIFIMQEPIRLLLMMQRTGRNTGSRTGTIAWGVTMGTVALLAGMPILLHRPAILWMLLPSAVVAGTYVMMLRRRASMNSLALVGFVGLALAAPAGRIAVAGGFDPVELLGLWLLATLFFCGSSYCVNIRLKGARGVAPALWYHAGALLVTILLALSGLLPGIAVATMLLAAGKLVWILADMERYRALPLKHIGILESCVSLLFVIIYGWQ
jgi:hypothetical protein